MNYKDLYIGILTGTSMDSIDCGIFHYNDNEYKTIAFYENNYPDDLKKRVKKNYENLKKGQKNSVLDTEFSKLYAKYINKILIKENISSADVRAIGMHGQTISHGKRNGKNYSIQIGCPDTLKKATNISVISNFRQTDIENGGEGAPLAPLYHNYIFQHKIRNRAIVNIGGIANISFIPKFNSKLAIKGFDVGPGNTLIDLWANEKFQIKYDKNGDIAKKNNINKKLLNLLLDDKYFLHNANTKSTTTEYFSREWVAEKLNKLNIKNLDDGDILATLTELTAVTIFKAISKYENIDDVYICGGGAFNKTILDSIKEKISCHQNKNKIKPITVESTSKININPKSVESGLFAWLAYKRIKNNKLDYSRITGSKKVKTVGIIY